MAVRRLLGMIGQLIGLAGLVLQFASRGAIVAEYPYPVLEANRLGYAQVSVSTALLLIGLAVLCATVVTLDKPLPNRGTANA